jgi:O-antigen ligase
MRYLLFKLFALAMSVYAWRNWFVALCVTILLMGVIRHRHMPDSIGDIQGLNYFNILLLNVLLAWYFQRGKRPLAWDMPRSVTLLLAAYFLVVLVGFLRLWIDPRGLQAYSSAYLISEHLVNCVKWTLPGFLLFDACRTRRRILIALVVLLGTYVLLAVQVIRCMPIGYLASGERLAARAANSILTTVGYSRVNMSMMLSGAFWACVAILGLFRSKVQRLAVLGAAGIILLGQALTGGRAGYGTWALVGLLLCVVRWRRFVLLIPVVVLAVTLLAPGVSERMLMGFGARSGPVVSRDDDAEITSGRTLIWPYVIAKIQQSPVIGYGRLAMIRTGLKEKVWGELGESFPHPHNAYLEILLDNGILGLLAVVPFYLLVLWHGFQLLSDRTDAIYGAAGGVACSLVLALLIAGIGSQTFYPREGAMGMWCAIGVMLRVSVERSRSMITGKQLFDYPGVPSDPS